MRDLPPRPRRLAARGLRRREATAPRAMRNRIAIAGSIAQKPRHGGHTWVFLQYLLTILALIPFMVFNLGGGSLIPPVFTFQALALGAVSAGLGVMSAVYLWFEFRRITRREASRKAFPCGWLGSVASIINCSGRDPEQPRRGVDPELVEGDVPMVHRPDHEHMFHRDQDPAHQDEALDLRVAWLAAPDDDFRHKGLIVHLRRAAVEQLDQVGEHVGQRSLFCAKRKWPARGGCG